MMQQRNIFIDSLKGITIILMVVGHSGCPKLFHDYIYLFHMPLFFFISGYLFRIDYFNNPKQFIWRRIKSCYVPFIKYSLLFLLAHELLVPLGFSQHYAIHNYVEKLLYIMLFSGTEPYLGPFWFLIYMFFSSVIFIVFSVLGSVLLRNFNLPERIRNIAIMGGVILLSTFVIIMLDVYNMHIPKLTIGTMMAVNYIALGNIWRRIELQVNLYVACALLLLLLVVVYFTNVQSITAADGGMLVSSFHQSLIYTTLSLTGILGIWGVMQNAQSLKISASIGGLGRCSMAIMTFHFLAQALFLNSIKFIGVNNLPLFCWPISENVWWLPLTVCSILISLVLMRIEEKLLV